MFEYVSEGCVLQETEAMPEVVDKNDGKIEIKVQLKDKKEPISVRIFAQDPMKKAIALVSKIIDIPVDSLKLEFDGDTVEDNETPLDLDLDGGEMFDLKIMK